MSARYADPFEALFRLQRDLEERLASGWLGDSTGAIGVFPPINIFQQGDDYVAIVETPGVGKETLELQVQENTIRISGRKAVEYGEGVSVHRRERVAGTFDRTIALPFQVDPDGVRADFRDGVLALLIPRAESAKPRTIKIS
jgi:HSP20 family protein